MAPRRRTTQKEFGGAVGSFIRPHIEELRAFADYLNTAPRPPAGGADPESPLAALHAEHEATHDERLRGWQAAREIADFAAGQSAFDPLPLEAVRRFGGLARRTPVRYRLWRYAEDAGEAKSICQQAAEGEPHMPARHYMGVYRLTRSRGPGRSNLALELGLESDSPTVDAVASLARYLMNPRRDRLRRCPRCSRWFVDSTRNKSQQRCSRACTIAWSNSQRSRARKRARR